MVETLIVGAGPYGLGLANYLHDAGKEFRIHGRMMDLWRNHTYDTMRVRSDYNTSTIVSPDGRFSYSNYCAANGIRLKDLEGQLPVHVFRHYIDWVEKQLPYEVDSDLVSKIDSVSGIFYIKTEGGQEIIARRVVIATGIAHYFNLPEGLQHPNILHSYDVASIQKLENSKVLVIGSGQSAAESIHVLQQNGNDVHWYYRSDPIYYSEPLNLPEPLFKIILALPRMIQYLPRNVKKRLFSLFSATTITPDHKASLMKLQPETELKNSADYDVIVACTGYRYDVSSIPFLSEGLKGSIRRRDGMPLINRHFESSVPGLHFAGALTENRFGPSMKFMIGSDYSARHLRKYL